MINHQPKPNMATPARKTTPKTTAPTPVFTVVKAEPTEPAAPKKKGLNLAGIATAPKAATGKTYPLIVPDLDPETLAEFRAQISTLLTEKEEFKALKGTIESRTGDVLTVVRPEIHRIASGSAENSHAVLVNGEGDDVALVNMIKKYKAVTDAAGIVAAIGQAKFDLYIDERTELKIDFQKVPEAVQQDFLNAIVEAAQRLECTGAIEAKQVFAPKPHFHALRRTQLSIEENIALDAVMPLEVHVKRKGGSED